MNPIKTTPKDFFFHLGATVALYATVIALINLSFSIINYFFPDALAGYFYASSVAWPISMLIVLVPVLYIVEWFINKDIVMVPEKKDLWIRKWRIYLTIFLAGVIVIGDLITLLNTYLNGEISVRFVFKVLAVLLVSGAVFKYYFFSINEKYKRAQIIKTFHAWFGLVLVMTAIVLGFIAVGSPTKQRAIRFDNQRISDLQNIQWQIVNYWQQKNKMPATLEDLKDPISGSVIPKDPENESKYEYTVKNANSFELCATFSLQYEDTKGRGTYGGSYATDYSYPVSLDGKFNHQAGRTCFERVIDPEKYPQIRKGV